MPWAPAKPCSQFPCPHRQPCPVHGKGNWRTVAQRRGSAASRGYDRDWAQVRRLYMMEHPYCEDCLPHVVAATEVHHKRKVSEYPELRLDPSNLRSLCRECHAKLTRQGL